MTKPAPAPSQNPVLSPWAGPHGGAPAFDGIRTEHFEPAIEEAIGAYRAEITAITNNRTEPTFANTLEALEQAGELWRRATALLSIFTSTMNDEGMRSVQRNLAPKLA